jgi:hypothetical protein
MGIRGDEFTISDYEAAATHRKLRASSLFVSSNYDRRWLYTVYGLSQVG